jgi:protein phosphatase
MHGAITNGEAGGPGPKQPSTIVSVKVDISGLSDQGKIRPRNEDHFYIACFGRFLQTVGTNMPEGSIATSFEEAGYVTLVADGMGGHAAGALASQTAINSLVRFALETPDWILRIGGRESEEVRRRMASRFDAVNAEVSRAAASNPNFMGMGTTLTVAGNVGADLFLGHVGDSRAYLLRRRALHRLTPDDTMAQAMIEAGIISATDPAATERFRHILTQCIGANESKCNPHLRQVRLQGGDSLLICTDGLTDMLTDQEIKAVLEVDEPAGRTCRSLVDLALARGGRDNVTVVVARYAIEESSRVSSAGQASSPEQEDTHPLP